MVGRWSHLQSEKLFSVPTSIPAESIVCLFGILLCGKTSRPTVADYAAHEVF